MQATSLPPIPTHFGLDWIFPWGTALQHPTLKLSLLSWGTKTSAPGSDTGTPHESTGCFSISAISSSSFPSSSDAFRLSRHSWENRLLSFDSLFFVAQLHFHCPISRNLLSPSTRLWTSPGHPEGSS